MTGRVGRDAEEGQVLLVILVYCLITVSLVGVVTSASAVHLERKRLLALADGAALDAADALDTDAFYRRGASPGVGVPLTDASVRASVHEYVELAGAREQFEHFAVAAGTGTADGRTAQVTLVARARPPLLTSAVSVLTEGVPLTVTASARTRLGSP